MIPELPNPADVQDVDLAVRMMRRGAAAFIRLVPGELEKEVFLFGPGFQITITRTDPDADYPGSVQNMREMHGDG